MRQISTKQSNHSSYFNISKLHQFRITTVTGFFTKVGHLCPPPPPQKKRERERERGGGGEGKTRGGLLPVILWPFKFPLLELHKRSRPHSGSEYVNFANTTKKTVKTWTANAVISLGLHRKKTHCQTGFQEQRQAEMQCSQTRCRKKQPSSEPNHNNNYGQKLEDQFSQSSCMEGPTDVYSIRAE